MVYVIQVCWQLASRIKTDASWSCSQSVSKLVWHIPLLCSQRKTHDDGQRNCPKHVEFYSKNKFEKLVHLVGFIIRIYHEARSPERQKMWFNVCTRFMLYRTLLFHSRRRTRKEREWSCITWMDSYISDIGQDRAIQPLYKHEVVWTIRISGWSGSLNRLQQQCSKAKRTVILLRQCSRITVIIYKRYLFLHLSGLLKSLLE